MNAFSVLVVDDEERIVHFLKTRLKALGYEVLSAANGIEAVEMAQTRDPDLIVLDLIMPDMDGIAALKEIRSFSTVPVIVLSARGADADRILGLELGADDYLPKPFNPDELVARISAIRRRVHSRDGPQHETSITVGHVTVDFSRRCAVVNGQDIYLTKVEWTLLSELVQNAGRLMTYEHILIKIWGEEYRSDVQLLRTWISRLRRKLELNPRRPQVIHTIAKVGYSMHSDGG